MNTSRITIYNKEQSVNKFRKITILLDGKYCCAVANGERHSIALSPGAHTLKAKIDWCGSNPLSLEIKESEQTNIALSCNYHPETSILGKLHIVIFFGGLLLNLYFKSATFLWFILGFSLLYQIWATYKRKSKGMFYYLTIGRKKFLRLKNEGIEEGKAMPAAG